MQEQVLLRFSMTLSVPRRSSTRCTMNGRAERHQEEPAPGNEAPGSSPGLLHSSTVVSASQPLRLPHQTHKGTSGNHQTLRWLRTTAEFYISAHQTPRCPDSSCKITKPSKGSVPTGQMLTGKVGSTFCESYLFRYNTARL